MHRYQVIIKEGDGAVMICEIEAADLLDCFSKLHRKLFNVADIAWPMED